MVYNDAILTKGAKEKVDAVPILILVHRILLKENH